MRAISSSVTAAAAAGEYFSPVLAVDCHCSSGGEWGIQRPSGRVAYGRHSS